MAGTSRLDALRDQVASHLDAERIIVALSGGADSAVLAWACAESGVATSALFADHGLEHSGQLGSAAAAIAEMLGIEIAVAPAHVTDGPSLEARARAARYAALDLAAGDGLIATGHTADDQAETVLGHLFRGSGAAGLAGIPQRRGRWIRPLLAVRRTDVRAVADELGLPYMDDPANNDLRHQRNVLRRELPGLTERFNPDLVATLNRTAGLLRRDEDALLDLARQVPLVADDNAILVPAPVLATLPAAVAARVVRRALRLVHPPYPGDASDVAAVMEVTLGSLTAAEVSGGYRVEREGPMVAIFLPTNAAPPPSAASLRVPGAVQFGDWRLSAAPSSTTRRERWSTLIGAASDLTVRTAAEGERIDIGGGSKPVRDAMAEAGIPSRLRAGWPVVAMDARIVWLVGARRAAWAKPDALPAVLLTAERTRS